MYLDRYANVNFQHDKSVGLKDNWGSGSFAASSIVGAIPSTGPITINGSAHVLSLLSPAEHVYPYKTMTQFHNWLHSFEHGPTHHWMDYGSIRGGVVRGSLHRFEHGHDLVAAIHIATSKTLRTGTFMIHTTADFFTREGIPVALTKPLRRLLVEAGILSKSHAVRFLSANLPKVLERVGGVFTGIDVYNCFIDAIPHTLSEGVSRIVIGVVGTVVSGVSIIASDGVVTFPAGLALAASLAEVGVGVSTLVRYFRDPYIKVVGMKLSAFVHQLWFAAILAALFSIGRSLYRRENLLTSSKGVLWSVSGALASRGAYSVVAATGVFPGVGLVAGILAGTIVALTMKMFLDHIIPDTPPQSDHQQPRCWIETQPMFITECLLILNPLSEARVIRTDARFLR